MNQPDDNKPPVVETAPRRSASIEALEDSLGNRIRQQEILAELGVFALQGASFDDLLTKTARLTAEGLKAEFCKVMENLPAENRLVVRAGVGWDKGVIGSASVGADLESPAGFALHTGKPVISNHLENEQRFRTPDLLVQHGIRRGMNVILQGDGSPFGVLEVDSRSEGEFVERDIAFLQGAANILGMAIERQRHERQLKEALGAQQVLLKEINHRAKNSLQLVSGMLSLQAKRIDDASVREHLTTASNRISAIARLYELLAHDAHPDRIDLGAYLAEVCKGLAEAAPRCEIHVDAAKDLFILPERAVPVALIVNELITNACKYAYGGNSVKSVWVRIAGDGERISISIRDEGVGLPPSFDAAKGSGLGMSIVTGLVEQLGATFSLERGDPGTAFTLVLTKA
jgi:two-component sensor histidine kinase